MEARNIPHFGEPVLIQELAVPSQWMHKSVSITGRLDQHDISNCRAKLVDPKTQTFLVVDTTLVEPFAASIGSLFQFIGEMEVEHGKEEGSTTVPQLQARIVRCCDGLDLLMYEEALRTQREYLKSRVDRTIIETGHVM